MTKMQLPSAVAQATKVASIPPPPAVPRNLALYLLGAVEEALDPAVVAGVLGEELQAPLVPEVAAAVLHAQVAVPIGRGELGGRDIHHRHLPRGHQEAVGFQDF